MKKIGSLLLSTAAIPSTLKPIDTCNPDCVCPNRINFTINADKLKIPYCRNISLEYANEDIKQAVIIIHGLNRNAHTYYTNILNAARDHNGADQHTIILAPQFLLERDIENFELSNKILFWSNHGWKQGNKSLSTPDNHRPFRISSFSAIAQIIQRLARPNRFPNLRQITIAGHSAGGQFVNRFAAANQVKPDGISLRYIVANPSSYLYFNQERRVEKTLNQFAVPDVSSCPNYNKYKYGLEDLNSYMKAINLDQIRSQYLNKEVIYLLGSEDNRSNSFDLDTSCEAMLQGKERLERGMIYFNYLRHYYGSAILETHKKVIVPGVQHDDFGMFNSESVKPYLFD